MNFTISKKFQELAEMRSNSSGTVRIAEVDEANLLHWVLLLYPVSNITYGFVWIILFKDREPYNRGAFRVTVDFPTEYPFKPPRVTFVTKVCIF